MKAAETRTAILDAAVDLASRRGLEELSIGGLASAVKMSKSGLFARFGSKQDLQLATVVEAWRIFESKVLREPEDGNGPGLSGLLERWLAFYERGVLPGGCFFVISAVELAGRGDPVSRALAETVEQQIAELEAAVQNANASGELRIEKEPRRTALILHSLLVNANSLYQLREDPVVFDDVRATIAELLASSVAL